MVIDTGKAKDGTYLNKVVMIQAIMRTYLDIKKVKQLKESKKVQGNIAKFEPEGRPLREEGQSKQESKPTFSDDIYKNPVVEEISKNLGEFEYGAVVNDGIKREKRPAVYFENGSKYTGEWNTANNQRDGKGVQFWADGSKYEGFWKNDKANGRGRLIHSDGDVYEGEWKDDKSHGYGVYLHSDGAQYQGDWVEDKQEGFGVEEWPDKARYQGTYKDGMKEGKGVFYWSDGSKYSYF